LRTKHSPLRAGITHDLFELLRNSTADVAPLMRYDRFDPVEYRKLTD